MPSEIRPTDLRMLRSLLGVPVSLAEWVSFQPDYPEPFHVPADQCAIIAQYVRLREAIRVTARFAPWLSPRGVTL